MNADGDRMAAAAAASLEADVLVILSNIRDYFPRSKRQFHIDKNGDA
ncbi:hypothetical protein [Acetomicrobium sp.]